MMNKNQRLQTIPILPIDKCPLTQLLLTLGLCVRQFGYALLININYSNSSAHISIFIADKGERTFSVMKLLKSIPDSAAFSFMNTFFTDLTELLLHEYVSNKSVLKKKQAVFDNIQY